MTIGINKVTLQGRLKSTPLGKKAEGDKKSYANLLVAIDSSYKNKETGEYVNQSDDIIVYVYNSKADACLDYLEKGQEVLIEGKLRPVKVVLSNETAKEVVKFEVIADNVIFGRKSQKKAAEDTDTDSN